jgi:hypothetical protein
VSHPLLGDSYHYSADYGGFISAKIERVAIFIHEYDDELELGWIPSANREDGDKPFCIIHNHPNGTRQPISFWDESQVNIETIGVWLFENDFRKHSPDAIFDRVQAGILAKQLADAKETEDIAAEKWDFGKSVLTSPLNYYKHNGKTWT